MKKRSQSQSQRKAVSKSLYERNILKNKYSNVNTFRQTKDSKYFSPSNESIKKKIITSHQESPKTIDYMQVMQKYEHLIEQNSENEKGEKDENKINNYYKTEDNLIKKINNHNNINNDKKDLFINFCRTDDNNNKINKNLIKEKIASPKNEEINNIIYLDYEKSINKSYKNIRNFFNDKIGLNKNILNNFFEKNEEYKKNNLTSKISKRNISNNSQSYNNLNNTNCNQNNFYKKYNNNKSFSFFQDLLNAEKNKRSNEINTSNNNNNFNNNNLLLEKTKQIISLCQKYAKIMSNSINFIEVNSVNNSSDIFHELKNIIKQYNKFIFSEKIKNLFLQQDFLQNKYFIQNNNNNFTLKEFEPKNLNFTEKFRNKISALKNEKCKIHDELNAYKKKNKYLLLEKDEMEIVINKLKKENEDLKDKIKNLENYENQYNIQNNEINKLKGQIENLNIDIKYKENIINNLQHILEQINYNKNNNIKNNYNNFQIENNKQNESGFLSDINNDSIEKDIIAPTNLNVNSIIDNILNLEDDNNKKYLNDIKINNNIEEQKIISEKMEKIDQDILDLKTKLKKIYSK